MYCKITQTVALKNPIAPHVFNRNEETKSSLVKKIEFLRYDVIQFNEAVHYIEFNLILIGNLI